MCVYITVCFVCLRLYLKSYIDSWRKLWKRRKLSSQSSSLFQFHRTFVPINTFVSISLIPPTHLLILRTTFPVAPCFQDISTITRWKYHEFVKLLDIHELWYDLTCAPTSIFYLNISQGIECERENKKEKFRRTLILVNYYLVQIFDNSNVTIQNNFHIENKRYVNFQVSL